MRFLVQAKSRRILFLGAVVSALSVWAFAQVRMTEVDTRKIAEGDPFRAVEAVPPVRGRLVYNANFKVPEKNERQRYLVVRKFGESDTTTFHVEPGVTRLVLFPKFSHDGQKILFASGYPFEIGGSAEIDFWDLESKKLTSGPRGLAWLAVLWSPNGRYLAYWRGVDYDGGVPNHYTGAQLEIYDLMSTKVTRVARNPGVFSAAWTAQNTLLYTLAAPAYSSNDFEETSNRRDPTVLIDAVEQGKAPGIYEFVPTTIKSTLLIESGASPAPSPDGKLIAYSDTTPKPTSTDWTRFKFPFVSGQNLKIFRRMDKSTQMISGDFTGANLIWSPDSKRLIALKQPLRTKRALAPATVSEIDITTGQTHKVMELALPKFGFDLLGLSRDGNTLFLSKGESAKSKSTDTTVFAYLSTVQAVDLSKKTVSDIAKVESDNMSSLGLDWIDDTELPGSQISPQNTAPQ